MEKPTPAALAAFDAAFPKEERAVRKKMFGMPAGFVNGNMFLGVFANGLVIRGSAATLLELRDHDGVGDFEPMPGRPWKDYVHVNADRWGGTEQAADWALDALEHTAAMPPKQPKAKKPKK